MVAAAEKPLVAQKPSKPTRKGAIPLLTRMLARNLYLTQGLPYKAISAETGLPVPTLEQLSHREGWVDLRRQAKARLLKNAEARTQALEAEMLESVVGLAGQHALQGLNRTGEALERTDRDAARDFQSYTSGVKNLVSIMRDIRQPQSDGASEGARLNVFVLRVGDQVKAKDAATSERNVTPNTAVAIELAKA